MEDSTQTFNSGIAAFETWSSAFSFSLWNLGFLICKMGFGKN